jgi:hypothetical protein
MVSRGSMQPRFGHDFSRIPIHPRERYEQSAIGTSLAVNRGARQPSLAHGRLRVSQPGDAAEIDADHMAADALRGPAEIGGDGKNDIPFETYLRDWHG